MRKVKLIKGTLGAIITTLTLIVGGKTIYATTAYPYSTTITQPNGEDINTKQKGNESFHYRINDEGYVIEKDETDQYWKYIEKDGDDLSYSGVVSKESTDLDNKLCEKDFINNPNLMKEYYELSGRTYNLIGSQKSNTLKNVVNLNEIPGKKFIPKRVGASELSNIPLIAIVVEFEDEKYIKDIDWNKRLFSGNNSITGYYSEVSKGKFTFTKANETSAFGEGNNTNTSDAINDGIIHITLNRNHGNWNSLDNEDKLDDLGKTLKEALMKSKQYIDFSSYDKNENGYIDNEELALLFIMAGYETSFNYIEEPSIWSHSYNMTELTGDSCVVDGIELDNYIAMGEKFTQVNEKVHPNCASIVCHELGHYLGLSDLYDTLVEPGEWISYQVGALSLMASGSWGSESFEEYEFIPTHLDPFSKMILGFDVPVEIEKSGEYTVNSVGSKEGYGSYMIRSNSQMDYYIIENRQYQCYDRGLGSNYEYGNGINGLNKTGGVVVWHINNDNLLFGLMQNDMNNSNHKPAVMPVFPPDLTYFSFYPFWNCHQEERLSRIGKQTEALCQLYTDSPRIFEPTGIRVKSSELASNNMVVQVTLPDAKIDSIFPKSLHIANEGEKKTINITGENFYQRLTATIFDENGKQVGESFLAIETEEKNLKEQKIEIELPEGKYIDEKKYEVRISADGGKTYFEQSVIVTQEGASLSETTLTDSEKTVSVTGLMVSDARLDSVKLSEDSQDIRVISNGIDLEEYQYMIGHQLEITSTYDKSYVGNLFVTFHIGDSYNGKKIILVYKDNDNTKQEVLTVIDGDVSVTLPDLSNYAIYVEKEEPTTEPTTEPSGSEGQADDKSNHSKSEENKDSQLLQDTEKDSKRREETNYRNNKKEVESKIKSATKGVSTGDNFHIEAYVLIISISVIALCIGMKKTRINK